MPPDITRSFWEETTPPRKTARTYEAPSEHANILIVGAGLCGSWLAYFLNKHHPDLKITVVERAEFGHGASTKNAGFLSTGNIAEWIDDIEMAGFEKGLETLLARVEGLDIVTREFGNEIAITNCGSADFSEVTDEKIELMHEFNKALQARSLKPYELRDMEIGGRTQQAIFNHYGAPINPAELLQTLHAKLLNSGVELAFNTTAESLEDGTARFVSADGTEHTVEYDYGFLCTNAFAKDLHADSIVTPARGQIIVTSPCDISNAPEVLGFEEAGYNYFRRAGEDRFLIGGGRHIYREIEDIASFETTAEIRDYLIGRIKAILGHSNFTPEYHWAGVMGFRKGQHVSAAHFLEPVMIDSKTEALTGFSGWGVTLTPWAAQKKAQDFSIS